MNMVDNMMMVRDAIPLEELSMLLGVGPTTVRDDFHNFKRNNLEPESDYIVMTSEEVETLPDPMRMMLTKPGVKGKKPTAFALTQTGISKFVDYYDNTGMTSKEILDKYYVKAVVEDGVVEEKHADPSDVVLRFSIIADKLADISDDMNSLGTAYERMYKGAQEADTKRDATNKQIKYLIEENASLRTQISKKDGELAEKEQEVERLRNELVNSGKRGAETMLHYPSDMYQKLYARATGGNVEYGITPKYMADVLGVPQLDSNTKILAYYLEKGIISKDVGYYTVRPEYGSGTDHDMFWYNSPKPVGDGPRYTLINAGWRGLMTLVSFLVADGLTTEYRIFKKFNI